MHLKDRQFILSLPRYPMEFVGKLPDAITCKEDKFELKDKQGNMLLKVKKEIYEFQDFGQMGYWVVDREDELEDFLEKHKELFDNLANSVLCPKCHKPTKEKYNLGKDYNWAEGHKNCE